MMFTEIVVSFLNTGYGRIECERMRDGTGVAYSFYNDHEYQIDKDGYFQDLDGLRFRVIWPSDHLRPAHASLEVYRPVTLARVEFK
jgi:hypothetical protein